MMMLPLNHTTVGGDGPRPGDGFASSSFHRNGNGNSNSNDARSGDGPSSASAASVRGGGGAAGGELDEARRTPHQENTNTRNRRSIEDRLKGNMDVLREEILAADRLNFIDYVVKWPLAALGLVSIVPLCLALAALAYPLVIDSGLETFRLQDHPAAIRQDAYMVAERAARASAKNDPSAFKRLATDGNTLLREVGEELSASPVRRQLLR